MKRKCQSCGEIIFGNAENCFRCHSPIDKKTTISDGLCSLCSKRGRIIPDYSPEGVAGKILCYWCYHEMKKKKEFTSSEIFKKKRFDLLSKDQQDVEKKYSQAIEKYYLVPLFYGDRPNMEMVQIVNDMKLGINQDLWCKLDVNYNEVK